MSIMPLSTAEYYKSFFSFLNWPARKNISHHFQYIEYLYKVKLDTNARLTIKSLLNKTLIIEMFSIVECIIYNLLKNQSVQISDGYNSYNRPLFVHEYIQTNQLIDQAVYYGILLDSMSKNLKKFAGFRNTIHIKQHTEKKKYEYEAYTDDILKQNEKYFRTLLEYLWQKYSIDSSAWKWPASHFGK